MIKTKARRGKNIEFLISLEFFFLSRWNIICGLMSAPCYRSDNFERVFVSLFIGQFETKKILFHNRIKISMLKILNFKIVLKCERNCIEISFQIASMLSMIANIVHKITN